MDFGKLADISRVDFRLPAEPRANQELLTSVDRKTEVYVGLPIWSRKDWVGKIYPVGSKPAEFLWHYTRQFNSIELNSTHYRVPDEATIREWRETAPEGFKFSPKFPQAISHDRMLQGCRELALEFCESVMGLGDRLGTSFLQLPPGFTPAQLPILRQFLEGLPRGFKLAVEFRHPAWFSRQTLRVDAARLLEAFGATALITDVAGRRDVLHMNLTAPRVMVRFVGNALHPTDFERIDHWIERLRVWMEAGLREIYFFVHQPDDVLAPNLSRYFVQVINRRCGTKVKDWTDMDQGQQMNLFG